MVGIVTGGSKGIGLAIARAFLDRGMQVTISGGTRSRSRGPRPRRLAAAANVHTVRADVRNPADAQRLVDETVRRFGGVDILVNNAGVGKFANVADMSLDDLAADHRHEPERRVLLHPRGDPGDEGARGGGFIINISSLAGKNPFAGGAAYCASKAGLNAFSEALMQEVRHDNIRVSYVMPGSVSTELRRPRVVPGRQAGLEAHAGRRGARGRRPDRARRAQPAEPRRAPAVAAAQGLSGAPDDMPTHRIAHYNLLDRIGEGGIGELFRARDTKVGRTVALKIVSPRDRRRSRTAAPPAAKTRAGGGRAVASEHRHAVGRRRGRRAAPTSPTSSPPAAACARKRAARR